MAVLLDRLNHTLFAVSFIVDIYSSSFMVIIPTRFACYLSTTVRLALMSIVILVARGALSMEWTYRKKVLTCCCLPTLASFKLSYLDDLQHVSV